MGRGQQNAKGGKTPSVAAEAASAIDSLFRASLPKRPAPLTAEERNAKESAKLKAAEEEYKKLSRETVQLGATQLDRKEQRKMMNDRIRLLGGVGDKPPKAPLKVLVGMRKKAKVVAAKKKELQKMQG